jgi:thiol-disulfide isomerase/thioredoxin
MKKNLFVSFIIAVLFLALCAKPVFISAQQNPAIEINFFYSSLCPHCIKEKEFLKDLKNKYPKIAIKEYEIINYPENQKILKDFYQKYQVPKREHGLVPIIFTPTKYFIGFNQQIGQNIESCLKECLDNKKIPLISEIKIPFFGKIDLSKLSLPALTITLGALDGLNPCAMWVLLFLITLLINTRSRKRMWLIGGTFIATSGVIYFLILSAWLNLFLAISYVNLTRILIGLLALGIGVWQIKNFITYHPGICKVLGMKSKIEMKIKKEAEKIVSSPLTLAMISGLILLALGINLVEFFCSAGLPSIYTRILTLDNLSSLTYYLYLLLYTFIFMLDDIIVFSLAIITFRRFGFSEKYNYWATLIGGLLIFILGILLIFKPEILMFS